MGKHEEIAQLRQEITALQGIIEGLEEQEKGLVSVHQSLSQKLAGPLSVLQHSICKLREAKKLATSCRVLKACLQTVQEQAAAAGSESAPTAVSESPKVNDLLVQVQGAKVYIADLKEKKLAIAATEKRLQADKLLLEKLEKAKIYLKNTLLPFMRDIETSDDPKITSVVKEAIAKMPNCLAAIRHYSSVKSSAAYTALWGPRFLYSRRPGLLDAESVDLCLQILNHEECYLDLLTNMEEMDSFIAGLQKRIEEDKAIQEAQRKMAPIVQEELMRESGHLAKVKTDTQAKLVNDTQKLKDLLAELGIVVYDINGQLSDKENEYMEVSKELSGYMEEIRKIGLKRAEVEGQRDKLLELLKEKENTLSHESLVNAGLWAPAAAAGSAPAPKQEPEPEPESAVRLHERF